MSSASHSLIESQPKEARPEFSWVSYETKRGSTFWETLWPHECLTEPQKVAPFLNCLGCSSCTLPLFPPSLNPKPYSAERFVASVWDDYHALFLFAPSLPRPSLPSLSRSLALLLSCSLALLCSRPPLCLCLSPLAATRREKEHQRRRGRSGGLPAAAAPAPALATRSCLRRRLAHRPQRGRRQAPAQACATAAPACAALLPPPPASLHKSATSYYI